MHNVIVIDDYVMVEHKDRLSRPGRDVSITCMCVLFPSVPCYPVCLVTQCALLPHSISIVHGAA